MATPPPPAAANPYQEGSLIFAMMTPPERSSKLTPRWKGPFRVKRVLNPFQVVYEDGPAWRTIHINHTEPAKFAAPDLPVPTPAPESPRPVLGYLPSGLVLSQPRRPPPPLPAAAPARGHPDSPAASVPTQRPSAPTASEMPPPAPAPANQNSGATRRPRRSPRHNPELDRVCAIKCPPGTLAPQSQNSLKMARTYPVFLSFNQCLGSKEDPLSFASICLEDLNNGRKEYLTTVQQLVDALPKTENPASRFALRGHVARPGQPRLGHSMRAALWWLLPSDGEFRRASHSLQYYLARQGRHVVLRGGDVTQPFYKSCLNWVPDPAPPAPRRLDDLVSPAAASVNPTPPSEAHPRLPGRSRRKRRRKRKAAAPTNENSAPRAADLATQPTLSANRNSAHWASSKATRPGSTGNGFPEVQPGTRSASVKHSQSFTSSPLTQHPVPATNRNSDRPFCLDQPGMTPDRIRLPIEIRPAGLPAKRPSLGQRPMAFQKFSLEPGVLQ